MPYVPPHKRAGDSKSKPESMSGSSSITASPQIRRDSGYIHKLMVISGESTPPLRFEVFQGTSYLHLSNSVLYKVEESQHDADHDPEDVSDSSSPDIDRSFSSVTSKVCEGLLSIQLRHTVNPKLCLRLGKILFRKRNSSSVDLPVTTSFSAERLDRQDYLHVFDTALGQDHFHELQQAATRRNPGNVSVKERYIIVVEDKWNPRQLLRCECEPVEDGKALALHKVKLEHLRHLVNDFLCTKKSLDFRVMVYSADNLQALPDETMAAVKAIAEAAIIDESLKGGLRWPLGQSSAGNRFRVQRNESRRITDIVAGDLKWAFRVANRSDRCSYEAKITVPSFKHHLGDKDTILNHLQALLHVAEESL